ncbi:hypothetical protein K3G63_16800 [Hymenobacter sp. HSC-4F20]|uniref:hypothetical protein n=1 Tax=Hymenobacter sp. HSC-4F20 TaxID=2864135 RepID=UPI001C73CD26|nr:hypothetical protein [Hymenobacter sp. HSC-4F20]MBX0292111.1 hypothetical protein [Hymenobacter sp. HSC-4F20]
MERNATRDLRLLLFVLIINVGNVFSLTKRHGLTEVRPALLALVLVMVAFVAWSMITQLRIVRRMQQEVGAVYLQLKSQIQRVRQLMQLRRYAGGLFLLGLITIILYSQRNRFWSTELEGIDWRSVALAILVIAALGVMVWIGEYKQQQRYGRHLDQLEAALRELEA